MKQAVFIFFLLSVIFMSSCGYYEKRSTLTVYNRIQGTNDTLDQMTKEWHAQLKKAMTTGNFTYLPATRIRLAQFLNRTRQVVANLEVAPNIENLRDSEVVFLSNQAMIAADVYPVFESNNELTPNDVILTQIKSLGNDLENEIAMNEAIKQSLHGYAKKSGLNLPQ